jgi:hypothetical protein
MAIGDLCRWQLLIYESTWNIRAPLDYEVCFEKIDGRWMMTSLVGHWE